MMKEEQIIRELARISKNRKEKIKTLMDKIFNQIVRTISTDDYIIEDIIIALINLLAYTVMIGVRRLDKKDRVAYAKALSKCIKNDLINFVKDDNIVSLLKECEKPYNDEKYISHAMYV